MRTCGSVALMLVLSFARDGNAKSAEAKRRLLFAAAIEDGMGAFGCVSKDKDIVIDAWRCDGEDDCANGEDEMDCAAYVMNCPTYQFGCKRQGKKVCLPATQLDEESYVCDGGEDCDNGEDEQNCN